jgi:hypothetical protein
MVKFVIALCCVLILAYLITSMSNPGSDTIWPTFIFLFGFLSMLLFGIFYREYYIRPKMVEILDDGILLRMRYSEDVMMEWGDIIGYFAYDEADAWIKVKDGSGALIPRRGPGYNVTFRIAMAVASKYSEIKGEDLPRMELNEGDKKFRKRALKIRNRYS